MSNFTIALTGKEKEDYISSRFPNYKQPKMTIYEIKRRTEETSPYFFSKKTMKFFNQTLKDFKVYKLSEYFYLITCPSFIGYGKSTMLTKRIFFTQTNELLDYDMFAKKYPELII